MQKHIDVQVRKIMKFIRQFQLKFSKIDQHDSMSTKFKAIFRICCARNGTEKADTLFFRLVSSGTSGICIFSPSYFPYRYAFFFCSCISRLIHWGAGGSGDCSRSTDSVVPGSIPLEIGWWALGNNGRFTFALAVLGIG